MPKPNRKIWVWSCGCFTTNGVRSTLISPNCVRQDTPTPTPILGAPEDVILIGPQRGQLLTLSGVLSPSSQRPEMPVKLTLITDTGRRLIASAAGPFEAGNLPPGPLELVAEGFECGSYTKLIADRELRGLRIGCNPLYFPAVDWRVREMPRRGVQYPIMARRVDLDGASAQPSAATPGKVMVLYGDRIGPTGLATASIGSDGKFANQIAGTQVLFDDVAAPMLYSSAGQTAVVVPYGINGKNGTQLKVRNGALTSDPALRQRVFHELSSRLPDRAMS